MASGVVGEVNGEPIVKSKKKRIGRPSRKQKRKLTAEERRARRERKKNWETIFVNGKQKRVRRPPTIDGLPVEEFIARNADPIWLHQEGLWHLMPEDDPPDSAIPDGAPMTPSEAPF
jgi:hypothetical protein